MSVIPLDCVVRSADHGRCVSRLRRATSIECESGRFAARSSPVDFNSSQAKYGSSRWLPRSDAPPQARPSQGQNRHDGSPLQACVGSDHSAHTRIQVPAGPCQHGSGGGAMGVTRHADSTGAASVTRAFQTRARMRPQCNHVRRGCAWEGRTAESHQHARRMAGSQKAWGTLQCSMLTPSSACDPTRTALLIPPALPCAAGVWERHLGACAVTFSVSDVTPFDAVGWETSRTTRGKLPQEGESLPAPCCFVLHIDACI